MSKVFIEETTLTAIGDAIRSKTGGEDLIAPGNMATEITNLPTGGGGGGEEPEPIVIESDGKYACSGQIGGNYIDIYGDTVSTNLLNDATGMFENNTTSYIPFEINFNKNSSYHNINNMFYGAKNLLEIPKMNNVKPSTLTYIFYNCNNIRNLPENFGEDWDWSILNGYTGQYSGAQNGMFRYCYSLRKLPMALLNNHNSYVHPSISLYYAAFGACYCLDEIVNLPVPKNATWTSNAFIATFGDLNRLKRLTFETNEDGTPKVMKWKSQTLDLSSYVGYTRTKTNITGYNSGITGDKEVFNSSDYQTLKDNPDWFTTFTEYSRYNHDSAVNTINSLPDTSAYLASAGGTNTIKFKGAAGSKTDGGAINTLTEEEIAVATAKGWTVSLV